MLGAVLRHALISETLVCALVSSAYAVVRQAIVAPPGPVAHPGCCAGLLYLSVQPLRRSPVPRRHGTAGPVGHVGDSARGLERRSTHRRARVVLVLGAGGGNSLAGLATVEGAEGQTSFDGIIECCLCRGVFCPGTVLGRGRGDATESSLWRPALRPTSDRSNWGRAFGVGAAGRVHPLGGGSGYSQTSFGHSPGSGLADHSLVVRNVRIRCDPGFEPV